MRTLVAAVAAITKRVLTQHFIAEFLVFSLMRALLIAIDI
jgi:hypothetical protein